MATTLIQARKLLTAAELEVFVVSRGQGLTGLSAVQLRGKVKRARTLSEKYRDLLQRQKLATRDRAGTKMGRSGAANARTAEKAALFADVLESFSRRLAQVEAAQARAEQKAAAVKTKVRLAPATPRSKVATAKVGATPRSPKAPSKAPVAARNVGPSSESARVARHAMQPKQSGQQNVHAHIAARGRRNQAKRDGRG